MVIYVLDGLNGISDIVDTFESVIWNTQFFGKGDFELIVPGTQKNVNMLKSGVMLVRDMDVTQTGFKHVMVIQNYEIEFDVDKGWLMTLTGSGLKSILGQRIVWTQTNLTGTVENGIRQVITDNVISPANTDRKIDNFILSASQGFTETFDLQLLGENIAEWLESTCKTYGYGWDVYIDSGKYVFTLSKGSDRTYDQSVNVPVVFSPEFDNLLSATYRHEKTEFRNAALVGGEGEGINQRTATVGTSTGLDRYEDYVDGSSVSSNGEIITLQTYLKMLEDFGKEQLSNTSFTEKFEGQIIQNNMYTLDEDYFLGDFVEIRTGFIEAKSRIIELIYSEDENGIKLVPTFSDWEE